MNFSRKKRNLDLQNYFHLKIPIFSSIVKPDAPRTMLAPNTSNDSSWVCQCVVIGNFHLQSESRVILQCLFRGTESMYRMWGGKDIMALIAVYIRSCGSGSKNGVNLVSSVFYDLIVTQQNIMALSMCNKMFCKTYLLDSWFNVMAMAWWATIKINF